MIRLRSFGAIAEGAPPKISLWGCPKDQECAQLGSLAVIPLPPPASSSRNAKANAMRFIGSKERLLPLLRDVFSRSVAHPGAIFGDLFCGTAVVSRVLKEMGFRVVANDNLRFCSTFAVAALRISSEPSFARLLALRTIARHSTSRLFASPYEHVLDYLNALPAEDGIVFSEYSADPKVPRSGERYYFTRANGGRIDAIRKTIAVWKQDALIDDTEECLLLTDLIRAANHVANIAGTYGCYLKHWEPRALRALQLERSPITTGSSDHEVYNEDANELARRKSFAAVYLDPPYTWRHYGAYYHIPETIARGDAPLVSGRTGLRPWEDSRSLYCDRNDAARALTEIVTNLVCQDLFLSYSAEGLIPHEEIMEILRARGTPSAVEAGHRRYRSNTGGTRENHVTERLYHVRIT